MSVTPKSQRKHKKEIINKKKEGFKMVEKTRVLSLRHCSWFKPLHYEREDCSVCRTDMKEPCDGQMITYEMKYTECNNVYCGKHIEERIYR